MRRDVDNSSMPLIADFIAPTRHTDPAEALAQVQRIYQQQIGHLRQTMQRYVAGGTPEQPVRASSCRTPIAYSPALRYSRRGPTPR